jgi:hypothetical protein
VRLFVVVTALTAALSCSPPHVSFVPNPRVPQEFTDPSTATPTGEPESVGYTRAYEAFWWNCALVRANDLSARCPFMCSGTPAAAEGCAQGSTDADRAIRDAIKRYGPSDARDSLRSLAKRPDGREKLRAYFLNGPTAESVGP